MPPPRRRRLQVELLEARHLLTGVAWEGWVAAASDDAEQSASGRVRLTGSDLELSHDHSIEQTVGLRFSGVDIPQGASIQNAYIQFQVDETSSGPASLTIRGEAVNDASTFKNSTRNISSRTTTNAFVSWSPAAWTTVGQAGPDQRTSNISDVIQEIVDRSGWSKGNSLAVIITGSGKRVAESYNGDSSGAPLLHIDYRITNGSPSAADDAIVTDEETVLSGDVLAPNPTVADSDPNGDSLTVSAVNGRVADVGTQITLASGALLTVAANGIFAYNPKAQFESLGTGQAATDTFTYRINDGNSGTDTATVTITVAGINDSPSIAVNQGMRVNEGSLGRIITATMLNEGDPDDSGLGLTYTLTKAVTNGTLRLSGGSLSLDSTFTQEDIDNNRISYDHDGSETLVDSFSFSLADGGEDGATRAIGTFNITVIPVTDIPTLTTFVSSVETTKEDTEVEVTLAELKAKGDEADADGTVDAFVVKRVASGTLKIGRSPATATTWAAGTNDTIDATDKAYWTPALNVHGTQNAFEVLAKDDMAAESVGNVTAQIDVTAVNDIPTLTSFSTAVETTNEDTEVEVRLVELVARGDEADIDGNVVAFVVKSVASGTLRIGTSAATATAWVAATNDTIDATNHSYWTPAPNANGALKAFEVVATDDAGAESIGNIMAQVSVVAVIDIPTLTTFVSSVERTKEDTEVEVTLAELKAKGDEADVDGTVDAFVVKRVASGALKIGWSPATATAWAAGTNDTIDATFKAYWTPALNVHGTQNAFEVLAKDDMAAESVGNVTAQIDVTAVNDIPTLTSFVTFVGTRAEDTEVEVSLAELLAQGDEADIDGNVIAFVVKSVASGTLRIGTSAATATAWVAATNDTIDATNHSYWTPAPNANGALKAFDVVARDDAGGESTANVTARVSVTSINDIPTLSRFATVIDTTAEDTEVELALAELKAQGDEADVDGTVNAFAVKSVTSGTLKIGTSAATATTWAAGTNDTIDATNHSYWTPAMNANGVQNAFQVVARDNHGGESTGIITAQVSVVPVTDLPTLSRFVAVIDTTAEDTEVELTLAELKAQGDEAYGDGTVDAFQVKSVTTGTLRIGTSAATATAWAAGSNDTIDATHHAYWTPAPNATGKQNAFAVVAKGVGGLVSTPNVTAQIDVIADIPDNPLPTCGAAGNTCFAVIGDYGDAGPDELGVANLVKSWNPDFIITTGDNNYSDGEAATIDINIGQYYHEFIGSYSGGYGTGADINRFFPTLGNHDWHAPNAQPYLDYFTLPGNERYYEFTWGPVHLFAIDSDSREPDGNSSTSTQAQWLQSALAASTATWKIVYMHHPPYSSGSHGSSAARQWPYQEWGATAVLAGHDHTYERILQDGFPYFVNGLGGRSIYDFGSPVTGSKVRYNGDFGAMLVQANGTHIVYEFISRTGTVVDTYTVTNTGLLPNQDDEVGSFEVVDVRVATSSDDAEQWPDGSVSLTSSDLELTLDGSNEQTVGMRFTGVNIPQGASILNASIQFQADQTGSDPTSLTIRGQAIDDAATFTSSIGNISNRTPTNASVTWSPAPWLTTGEAGPNQQTTDIGTVIQEIVNRPGWSSGNSLAIIVTGTGKRMAESFDGVQNAAPLLHVEYTTTAPLKFDSVSLLSPSSLVQDALLAPSGNVVQIEPGAVQEMPQRLMDASADALTIANVIPAVTAPQRAGKDSSQEQSNRAVDQLLSDQGFLDLLLI